MSERSYTPLERVAALALELWRLRDALIRTTHDEANGSDLLRSLRVLVLDDCDALLLDLAGHFRIEHTVTTAPSIRAPAAGKTSKETGGVVLPHLAGSCMPDTLSRWRALRGIAPGSRTIGIQAPFHEYLDYAVGVDSKRGRAIGRKALLADMAEKAFGVHASKADSGAVRQAALRLEYGPHYLTLAQELAFETLDYGRKVLYTAFERLGTSYEHLPTIAGVAPRRPECSACRAILELTSFSCSACRAELLAPVQRDITGRGIQEQFREVWAMEEGYILQVLGIPDLVNESVEGFTIGYSVGMQGDGCGLVRTSDLKLSWRIQRDGRRYHADVSVRGFCGKWTRESMLLLYRGWKPGRAMIEIMGGDPRLRATSDGLPWDEGDRD